MATGLFSLPQDDFAQRAAARRARAQDYARLDPRQRTAYNSSVASQQIGEGLGMLAGQAVGAATGTDVRSAGQRASAAQQQIQRELAGVDPTDIDATYPVIIRVLHQNGLTAEAMAAAREYEELKGKAEDRATRARGVEVRALKAQAADKTSQLGMTLEKLQQLYARRDSLPEGSPERENIERAITVGESHLMKLAGGKLTKVDLGDRVVLIDPSTREEVASYTKGAKPTGGATGQLFPMEGVFTRDGRQVWQNRNGARFDDRGNPLDASDIGDTKPDSALDAKTRGELSVNEGLMANIRGIVKMLDDPKVGEHIGYEAYLNKLFDLWDRIDPQGVPIRSRVTNIGSQKLHERSGAAVSVQEFDRLRGFIPRETDSVAVARHKLASMYEGLIEETNAYRTVNRGTVKTYPALPPAPAPARGRRAAAPAAPAPAPAPAHSAPSGELGTQGNPHRPATKAEFDAIPSGHFWMNRQGQVGKKR